MKTSKVISALLLLLFLAIQVHGQDNAVVPQRTPEQEAVKQTEKLQQELNLTTEQARQIYEINLRYARERQISNTRSQAIERMKNKSTEIQRILNPEQNEHLQTKRYERTVIESPGGNQRQPMSSGFRSTTEFRSNPSVRIPSSDGSMKNTYRSSSAPTQPTYQSTQTVRRSSPGVTQPQSTPSAAPTIRNQQIQQGNSPSGRSSSSSLPASPRRSEQNPSPRR